MKMTASSLSAMTASRCDTQRKSCAVDLSLAPIMAVGVPRSAARSLLVALHTLRWVWVASSWPSQVTDLNGCEQRRHREATSGRGKTPGALRGKSGCLPNSVIRLRATVSALHGAWRALYSAPTMGCRVLDAGLQGGAGCDP